MKIIVSDSQRWALMHLAGKSGSAPVRVVLAPSWDSMERQQLVARRPGMIGRYGPGVFQLTERGRLVVHAIIRGSADRHSRKRWAVELPGDESEPAS